jgi:hypothetical protein
LHHPLHRPHDGHRKEHGCQVAAYLKAVDDAFGDDVDFAQLIKIYGPEIAGPGPYSPPKVIGTTCNAVIGEPDPHHVSTSFVERQNLTMRMGMRRFTRLTNGFSKKVENHEAAIAIHYMFYNYCRIHRHYALRQQWPHR